MGSSEWIAFGALIFTIISATWAASWALSGKIDTNRAAVFKYLKDIQLEWKKESDSIWTRINSVDRDFRLLLDAFSARASEPIHAIREKISIMEIEFHKTYVSQREYDKDHERFLLELKGIRDSMEKRLDGFDMKLDKMAEDRNGA